MLKKVRVRIVTDRAEMEGSLFDGVGSVTPSRNAECERMEMTTAARYYDDGHRVSISWEESEASGMQGSGTTVSYQKDTPGVVTMMRTGAVKTALVFERARRHLCVYQTPVMPFEVSVATDEVKNELESAGTLYLDYAVELRGATAERTRMTMTVLPYFDQP